MYKPEWVEEFKKTWGFYPICGGKDDTEIDQPTAPSSADTMREAIETEIEMLQPRLEAEREFGSQFAGVNLETLQEYYPEIAKLYSGIRETEGGRLARFEKSLQEELYPEETAVNKALGEKILGGLGGGIPSGVESAFRERFRSEEASAGRLGSPVGGVNVAREMAGLSEKIRAQRIGEALSYTGGMSEIGLGDVTLSEPTTAPTLTTGEYVSPFLGMESSIYGTEAGLASSQAQINLQKREQNMELASKFIPDVSFKL